MYVVCMYLSLCVNTYIQQWRMQNFRKGGSIVLACHTRGVWGHAPPDILDALR